MQYTNKMLLTAKKVKRVIQDHKIKILYIWAVIILLVLIGVKASDMMKPQEKTQMQILVEKQQNNLEIIWVKLEDQKILRDQISDLQTKLDKNVTEVKDIEAINSNIRNEMLKYANTLSLTWANESK